MKLKTIVLITALMIAGLLVSACGGGEPEATPTLSPDQIQTLAVETFASVLTQTALAAPTETPTPTNTATPLVINTLPAVTPFGATVAAANPVSACYTMTFLADIGIQDDAVMAPGETFTKTWKVKNTGTCAWDAGFKFAFTTGDAMSGETYVLPQSVPVNSEIEISVDMTAPNKNGTITGNWDMSTAGGQFFNDSVYVRIVVGGAAATGAPTATATATETPTP